MPIKITNVQLELKPSSIIKTNLGIENGGPVHKYFTDRCAKHMNRFIPKRPRSMGGSLREEVDIQTDSITYEMPYARYQYFGIRADGTHVVMNYSTPGTGPYWDERMWSAEGDQVVNEVKEMMEWLGRGGNNGI